MDVFKEWNEGESLLHVNNKTHNQQYNWNNIICTCKKNLHSNPSLDFLVFDFDTKLACGLIWGFRASKFWKKENISL